MTAEYTDSICEQHKNRFDQINRGSLAAPNDALFTTCAFGMQTYVQIKEEESTFKRLVATKCPAETFVEFLCEIAKQSTEWQCLVNINCKRGHLVFRRILTKLFTCFAKNELKRMNSDCYF